MANAKVDRARKRVNEARKRVRRVAKRLASGQAAGIVADDAARATLAAFAQALESELATLRDSVG